MLIVDIIWSVLMFLVLVFIIAKPNKFEQMDVLFWIIAFVTGIVNVFGDTHVKFYNDANIVNTTLFGVIVLIVAFNVVSSVTVKFTRK